MAKLVDDILLKVHRFCAPHPRRALEKAAFKGQRILYVCTSDAVKNLSLHPARPVRPKVWEWRMQLPGMVYTYTVDLVPNHGPYISIKCEPGFKEPVDIFHWQFDHHWCPEEGQEICNICGY